MDEDDLVEELRSDLKRENELEPVPVVRAAPARAKRGVPTWVPIIVVLGMLAVVVTGLVVTTDFASVFVYSRPVDQIMHAPNDYVGREMRVEGELREGSIQFNPTPCEHRFVIEHLGEQLPVRFPRCVVPDTFRDDIAMTVVVQGRLQSNNTFLADEIIPRCPSKYEMRQREHNGEHMPHALPPSVRGGETS